MAYGLTKATAVLPNGKLIASPTMVFGAEYAAGIAVVDFETGKEEGNSKFGRNRSKAVKKFN